MLETLRLEAQKLVRVARQTERQRIARILSKSLADEVISWPQYKSLVLRLHGQDDGDPT